MTVLIINPGSSSLKYSLFEVDGETLLADGEFDWSPQRMTWVMRRAAEPERRERLSLRSFGEAVRRLLQELRDGSQPSASGSDQIVAVGCRVVHGGHRFTSAVRVTADVKREIGELAELAPLHNPASLECIEAVEAVLPQVPLVVSFDTAFHSTLSEAARTYPVPFHWTQEWGLRRFGFHGLSHAYCAARAAGMLGRNDLRLVIAHLGQGASVSAVSSGVCVDTSMGFTPLEGLMMGTRSGTVDPGLLIHILRKQRLNVEQLDYALNHESGLLGVSGASSDLREVSAAAATNRQARLALDIYVHRIRQTVGAMAASLGGVDALVFTAGVGEHAREIRSQVCATLGHLGLRLELAANANRNPDCEIGSPQSAARILLIHTREDLSILRETCRLMRF